MTDFMLCGWRVRSTLPLPDLLPWTGDDRTPDLHIALGPVPTAFADLIYEAPLLQIGRNGCTRFTIEGVAAYLVDSAGGTVLVDPVLQADDPAVRTFLFGTAFAIICQRRGILPLHACCVRFEGRGGARTVAFGGPSGVGKSTLAAAFIRHGHTVLADDLTAVEITAGTPRVLPSFPRLKLWRNAMSTLGLPTEGLERVRTGTEKFCLPLDSGFSSESQPLSAMLHLSRVGHERDARLTRRRGIDAAIHFSQAVYQRRMMARLTGSPESLLSLSTRVAAAVPEHWTIAHVEGLERLDELVIQLAERFTPGAPP